MTHSIPRGRHRFWLAGTALPAITGSLESLCRVEEGSRPSARCPIGAHVREFANPRGSKLSSVPGLLRAPEWESRV